MKKKVKLSSVSYEMSRLRQWSRRIFKMFSQKPNGMLPNVLVQIANEMGSDLG
jgi:hypothetical protein